MRDVPSSFLYQKSFVMQVVQKKPNNDSLLSSDINQSTCHKCVVNFLLGRWNVNSSGEKVAFSLETGSIPNSV